MSANSKKLQKLETPTQGRLSHFNHKVYPLCKEADSLPEAAKIALVGITHEHQRMCVTSYVFLNESLDSIASRLEISPETVKNHVIAGCKHLLLNSSLLVPDQYNSRPYYSE
jgi:hypothetical protein